MRNELLKKALSITLLSAMLLGSLPLQTMAGNGSATYGVVVMEEEPGDSTESIERGEEEAPVEDADLLPDAESPRIITRTLPVRIVRDAAELQSVQNERNRSLELSANVVAAPQTKGITAFGPARSLNAASVQNASLYDDASIYVTGELPEDAYATGFAVEPAVPDGMELVEAYEIHVYDGDGAEYGNDGLYITMPVDVDANERNATDAFSEEAGSANGNTRLAVLGMDSLGSFSELEAVDAYEGEVGFYADGNAAYAVVLITIETTIQASDGNTYQVAVSFDENAGIPAGAELSAREVETSLEDAVSAFNWNEDDIIFYTKFLDISILYNGEEIEPNPGSEVSVSVRLLDADATDFLEVIHVSDNGETSPVVSTVDEEGTITFTTGSFSLFGFGGVAKEILSWTSDLLSNTILGESATQTANYAIATVSNLTRGLELLEAYTVTSGQNLWLSLQRIKDLVLGKRESVDLYSVVNGRLGDLVKENVSLTDALRLSLSGMSGYALIRDTGLRDRILQTTPGGYDNENDNDHDNETGNENENGNGNGSEPGVAEPLVTVSGLVPKNAELEVALVDSAIELSDGDQALLSYDISILSEGEAYQPVDGEPLRVTLACPEASRAIAEGYGIELWHVQDDGNREKVAFVIEDDAICFDAEGFSEYVVVRTVLEKTLVASDGNTYKITVSYDSESGLPSEEDGAELLVVEMDAADYEDTVAEALDSKFVESVKAFDISIVTYDKNGAAITHQPGKDVTVSIELIGESRLENPQVVHVGEDATDVFAPMESENADGVTLTFMTGGFSIFIVAKDTPTKTYTFMNGDAIYSKQVLKNGDPLVEPASPVKDGAVFSHWSLTESGEAFTGYGTVTVTDETDKSNVTLHAVYGDERVIITYHDQDGAVVQRKEVTRPTDGGTVTEDTTQVLYSPSQESDDVFLKFRYWTEGLANLVDPGNAPQAGTNGVITIDASIEDIDLYPVVSEGHWIYFSSNTSTIGGSDVSVSYVAPLFVVNGSTEEITAEVPTTAGYTFAGWYTRSNGGTQIFDENGHKTTYIDEADNNKVKEYYSYLLDDKGLLANNPTLYAHWTAAESVEYTVMFWRQKITDDKDAVDADKEYDFAESITRSAAPGTEVKILAGIDDAKAGTGKYVGFNYNSKLTDKSVKVKGDGSSILNVYYDRNLITINFVTRKFEKVSNPDTSGNTYYYNQNGYVIVKRPNNNYWYYIKYGSRFVDSRLVMYTAQNNNSVAATYKYNTNYYAKEHNTNTGEVTWRTFTTGTSTANRYETNNNNCYAAVDTVEAYTGLYGQKLLDNGYSWPEGYWMDPNNDSINWTYVTTAVSEFKSSFTTVKYVTDNSTSIKVRFYFQNPDGTENTDYSRDPDDEANYVKDLYMGSNGFKILYTGMHAVKYKIGDAEWTNLPASNKTIVLSADTKVYYERDNETLTYYDPAAQAAENKTVAEKSILYGSTIPDEALQPKEMRAGYTFTGWYYDENQQSPVKFGKDTMPANDVIIYAGWEKISYNVDIDPNGGEIGMPVNEHAMWFTLDYGESITEYTDIQRNYVLGAEDGDGLMHYEYKVFTREIGSDPDVDESLGANYKRTALYKENTETGQYIYEPGAYTLQGWFQVMPDGSVASTPYNFTSQINSDVRLRALWRRTAYYTVVYDVAAEGVRAPQDTKEYIEGASAVAAASFGAPAGKRFTGWKDKAGNIYQPNALIPIAENLAVEQADTSLRITLTAQYADANLPDGYMADYTFMVPRDEGWTEYYKQTIAAGETLVQPLRPDGPEGKVFVGWYLDQQGKRRFDGFGVVNDPVYTTLYAHFEDAHVITYYMANEAGTGRGDVIITTQTYIPGDMLNTLYVDCPTDDDHMVDHWTDGPNEYPYKAMTNTAVNDSLILWPVLREQRVLRFDLNGGKTASGDSTMDSVKIPAQGWPAMPAEPVREGYVFDGWFPEKDAGDEYEFNGPLPEGVELLYAHWSIDKVNPKKGTLTVLWYAQLPDSAPDGKTPADNYELAYSQTLKEVLNYGDYRLDDEEGEEKNATAALNAAIGGDIWSTDRLVNLYSGDTKRYNQADLGIYFQLKPDQNITFKIDDKVNNTIRIYFDRRVYTLKFHTEKRWQNTDISAYGNSIKYKNVTYAGSDYELKVWLEKDVFHEWPIWYANPEDAPADQAQIVFNSNKVANAQPFNGWVVDRLTTDASGSKQTFNQITAYYAVTSMFII